MGLTAQKHGNEGAPLRIGILLSRHFTLTAFSLFVDTFRLASDELDRSGRKFVDWDVISPGPHLIQSSCGVSVAPTAHVNDRKPFDYIVVVGGLLNVEQQLSDELLHYLKGKANAGVPVIGLCTGSFVLAEAGLLQHKTACVSWLHREEFENRFPDIAVVSHRLFIEDGSTITCAGGTAVADLAVHMVKRHVGASAAKNAMEILQIERQRSGAHIQARLPIAIPHVEDERVRLGLLFMEELSSSKSDIEMLAQRVGMSSRQFERLFKKEIGETPVKVFQKMKLEKSRLYVEHSAFSIMQIATQFGYESQSHFTKIFKQLFGMTPLDMRSRRHHPKEEV